MKGIKHILIMIALIVASMSCCQADDHDLHAHDAEAGAEICSSHDCSCHTCDETACSDVFEMPQRLVVSTAMLTAPTAAIELYVLSETKRPVQQVSPAVTGILASIQTVQLLI